MRGSLYGAQDLQDARVIVLDEPFNGVDSTTQDVLLEVLSSLRSGGAAVVMATHDQRIVNMMRKRVIQLEDGRVVRDDRRVDASPDVGPSVTPLTADRASSCAHLPPRHARPPAASAAARRASACSRATDTSTCIACRSGLSGSSSWDCWSISFDTVSSQ